MSCREEVEKRVKNNMEKCDDGSVKGGREGKGEVKGDSYEDKAVMLDRRRGDGRINLKGCC